MARIYLDSNVFISYVKDEIGFNWRALFIETEKFFERVAAGGHVIVLSSLFLDEVKKITRMNEEGILGTFGKLNIRSEIYPINQVLFTLRFKKLGIHQLDAIHVAASIESGCTCIVTFNMKDFARQQEIPVFQPATFR
ncbi:MAG: hypothetical protein AABW68_05345 [archaeon]